MNWETINTFHKSLPSNSSECLVLIRDSVFRHCSSSVIRQQCKSQNGCFKKQSTPNFPKNEHFLPPDAHTAHHGVINVCFSENLACFVFWSTRCEIRFFAWLPTCWGNNIRIHYDHLSAAMLCPTYFCFFIRMLWKLNNAFEKPTNCLRVFGYFVGLALKGLNIMA